ncbi:MAG: ArsA family ATPase [Actinobacteria bacterium]|nr:ArsA family ATPase [Actinomycetota bacterium]
MFSHHRLLIVSGKGGVGKSSVAAAIAIGLADQGKRVLLAETENRQAIAALFGRGPLGYQEKLLLRRESGGEVHGIAIDPAGALLDYLDMFYKLRSAGSILERIGAVSFISNVAPGLRDILLTGKACEAVRRKSGDTWAYDVVVLDAPPTGRITRFLNVTAEVVGIVKVGPIKQQANWVSEVLHSDQTGILLVTTPEEMPIRETIEASNQLREMKFRLAGVIVNMVAPDQLTKEEAISLESPSAVDLLEGPTELVEPLMAFAKAEQLLRATQSDQLRPLQTLDTEMIELPKLGNSLDLLRVTDLAKRLTS